MSVQTKGPPRSRDEHGSRRTGAPWPGSRADSSESANRSCRALAALAPGPSATLSDGRPVGTASPSRGRRPAVPLRGCCSRHLKDRGGRKLSGMSKKKKKKAGRRRRGLPRAGARGRPPSWSAGGRSEPRAGLPLVRADGTPRARRPRYTRARRPRSHSHSAHTRLTLTLGHSYPPPAAGAGPRERQGRFRGAGRLTDGNVSAGGGVEGPVLWRSG